MVSIILPTYNESENIIGLINGLQYYIKQPLEIMVVDDNSPDKTWEIASKYDKTNVKVIRRIGERGLATAIDRGVRESRGEIVGWMDADMCMPPALLPEMIKSLGEYDIVIGSRYIRGGNDKRGFLRVFTSRLINWFSGLLLGFDIKDYDSGFIVLKKEVFNKIDFPKKGYGDYFIEFIYKCKRAGFRIKEVPYIFTDRKKGKSKTAGDFLSFIKLGFGYLLRIVKLRFAKVG